MFKSFRILLSLASLGLLGGVMACSQNAAPIGSADRSAVTSTVTSHYHKYAGEEDGYCRRPYFDTVTRMDLVEETSKGLVVDVRYSYRDRIRSSDDRIRGCQGFGTRRFTLQTTGGDVQVVNMSGTKCKGLVLSLDRALGLGNDRERLCP